MSSYFFFQSTGEQTPKIEKKLKNLKENVYCAAKSRVILTSNFALSHKGKKLISVKNKSCVISTFEYCLFAL